MSVETTDETSWQEQVENSDIPVLVDLWAPWCGPCLKLAPIIEQVATERAGRTRVLKLNVDENPNIALRYGIMSIPTLLILQDGQERGRLVGLRSAEEIEEALEQLGT